MTSATPIARSCAPDLTRAVDPTPNQPRAGLSSVYQVSAESTSTAPNERPMTAVAVWYRGSPPATSAGNRTRSRWSLPIEPSTWVRNSTRSTPSHSRVSWVTDRSPSLNVARRREPIGQISARTVAGTELEPAPGPFGDRCQGPSPCLGCCAYSSCSTSSLPGPRSRSVPVHLSVTWIVPPRAGSAVTRYAAFSIVILGISCHPCGDMAGSADTAYRRHPNPGTLRARNDTVTSASDPFSCRRIPSASKATDVPASSRSPTRSAWPAGNVSVTRATPSSGRAVAFHTTAPPPALSHLSASCRAAPARSQASRHEPTRSR